MIRKGIGVEYKPVWYGQSLLDLGSCSERVFMIQLETQICCRWQDYRCVNRNYAVLSLLTL